MSEEIVKFGIVLPILLLLIIFVIGALISVFIYHDNIKGLNRTNIMFLELDLKQWRIKKKPIVWNMFMRKSQLDSRINRIIGLGWVEIGKFFSIIGPTEEKRWKSAIEFCVQNKSGIKVDSIINIGKNEKSYWETDFYYVNKNTLSINVKWINRCNKDVKAKMINKLDLLNKNYQNQYCLFVCFNLHSNEDTDKKDFINKFAKMIKSKKILSYFVFKNTIVFVYRFVKFDKLQKTRLKINSIITKADNKMILDGFCDAISYIDVKEIKTESDIVKILTRISFGIAKSRLMNKPFYFNIKSLHFNEFEDYKDSVNIINDIIKNKMFNSMSCDVYSFDYRKKLLQYKYLKPSIDLDNNHWYSFIINTTNFNEKLRSQSLENHLRLNSNTPYMIDINDYDFKNFFNKIVKHKENIYIVNVVDFKKPLQIAELSELLKKHKIKFGLKVDKITPNTFSVFENAQPDVAIFSKEVYKNINNNDFNQNINNIGLILMCERLSITPIFEGINDKIRNNLINIGNDTKYFISGYKK